MGKGLRMMLQECADNRLLMCQPRSLSPSFVSGALFRVVYASKDGGLALLSLHYAARTEQ